MSTTNLARSGAMMLAAYALAAVLDYAYAAGMSWVLPPDDFGRLSVALSYFLLLSLFVANAFPLSLAKTLAESPSPPRGLVRAAVAGNLSLASIVVGAFVAVTSVGPFAVDAEYRGLLAGVAIAALLLSVASTLHYALQGRLAFGAFAVLHASKSLNKLLFGVALVLLGFGLPGAVGGLVVGAAVLALVAGLLVRRDLRGVEPGSPLDEAARRRFLKYTGAVFAGSFALTLLMNLDLLAVKYLAPGADGDVLAGRFQSASVLAKAPLWGVLAALGVVFPLMSRAAMQGPDVAAAMMRRTLRWTVLALAPIVVALAAFPRLALALLFPPSYAVAAPAVAVSAAGVGALALAFVLARSLQATGRARRPGIYLAWSAALQVGLLVVLVPRWGIVGAAAATTLASLVGALLTLHAAERAFGLPVRVRDVIALLLSAAILVLVVEAFSPTGRISTLVAFACGGLAYGFSAVTTGLVRADERSRAMRLLRNARARATLRGEA